MIVTSFVAALTLHCVVVFCDAHVSLLFGAALQQTSCISGSQLAVVVALSALLSARSSTPSTGANKVTAACGRVS